MFRDKQKHKKGHQRQNSGKMRIVQQENQDLKKYMKLLETFTKHEKIVIMLDARAPQAGRYKTFESILKEKLIFCINKIDLVPREMTLGWMSYLSKIAPTVALSATDSAEPLISFMKENEIKDICITGIKNSGKRTLAEAMKDLHPEVTSNWEFLVSTFEHLILFSIETIKPLAIFEHIMTFLDQCSPQSLMEVFGYTYASMSMAVFKVLQERSDDNDIGVTKDLLEGVWNGKYPFYSPPPTSAYDPSFVSALSEAQKKMLKEKTKVLDAYENPFIVLIEGDGLNKMIPSLLNEAHKLAFDEDNK